MPEQTNTNKTIEDADIEDGDSLVLELDRSSPPSSERKLDTIPDNSRDKEAGSERETKEESTEKAKEAGDGKEIRKEEEVEKPIDPNKLTLDGFELDISKPADEKPTNKPLSRDEVLAKRFPTLSDNDKALLKKTSNETFEYILPRLEENIKLKDKVTKLEQQQAASSKLAPGDIPKSYFQHPEAVTLTPQYRSALKEYKDYQFEASHWSKQLVAIEKGEDWEGLNYDPKTGKYTSAGMVPASVESKVEITRLLSNVESHARQKIRDINVLQDTFANRRTQIVDKYKVAEDQYFPDFKGDTYPEKKHYDALLNQLHADGLEDNILAPILAKAYAFIIRGQAVVKELEGKLAAKESIQSDRLKAGPTTATINTAGSNGSGGKSGERMLDVEDFSLD